MLLMVLYLFLLVADQQEEWPMEKKREISIWLATAVGLGAIIGAGIYVLSGTAIALAGADALLAFVLVGVVALIIALELGELGSLMPYVKGASYSYTYKALGSELGFITGMLRYFTLATSISVITLGFGSYLASFLGISVAAYAIPFAILLIALISLLNILGVKKAAEADFVLVVVKIGILLLFVGFALFFAVKLPGGSVNPLSFNLAGGGIENIFAASVVIFFAYSGFQSISTFSGRIRGKGNGTAKAVIAAVIISIVTYALVVIALLTLLPASSYKLTADPLAFALQNSGAPSWLALVVDIGALIATASAAIAMMLSGSRSLYQMSEDRLLPRIFRGYNKKTDSATNGIIVSAVIGIVMLFSGNIYVIASIANFGLMFDYLLVGFDVIHFRRIGSRPSFKMPLYPYLTAVATIALLAFFIGMPKEALVVGTVLVIALIAVYYTFREVKEKKVIRVKLFE
jgi:APA family basic amino acid/polyamine antiporter